MMGKDQDELVSLATSPFSTQVGFKNMSGPQNGMVSAEGGLCPIDAYQHYVLNSFCYLK